MHFRKRGGAAVAPRRSAAGPLSTAQVEATLRKSGMKLHGAQMSLFEKVLLATSGIDYHHSDGMVINFAQFLDIVNRLASASGKGKE